MGWWSEVGLVRNVSLNIATTRDARKLGRQIIDVRIFLFVSHC